MGYFIILLISILVLYTTGWLIELLLLKNSAIQKPFQATFFRTFLGLIVWVVGYSIIKSGGKTFNLTLVPLLAAGYFETKKITKGLAADSANLGWFTGVLPFASLLLSTVVFFVYKFQAHYVGGPIPFTLTTGSDYVQHSVSSLALQITGIEHKFAPEVVLDESAHGLIPYHYFDLWLGALISQLSGKLNYLCLELVTAPIFMIVSFLGLVSLWETKQKTNVLVVVFALLLVNFGSIHFEIYNGIHYLSKVYYRLNHFGEGVLPMEKLLPYVPFGLAFVTLIIKEYYKLAFIVLIALCMIYFSAIILLAVVGLFVLINLIKPIWIDKKDALILGLYAALPVIIFFGISAFFGSTSEASKDAFNLKLTDPTYTKIRINIIGLSTIQTVVMYFPLLIGLALIAFSNTLKQILTKQVILLALIIVLIYGVGILCWTIALESADGMQLLGNNMPVLNMALLGIFILLFSNSNTVGNRKWYVWLGVAIVLSTSAYVTTMDVMGSFEARDKVNLPSLEYLEAIQAEFKDEQMLIGGYLKGNDEYNDPMYAHANRVSQSSKLGQYLVLMPQYHAAVHMSVFDVPYTDPEKNAIEYQREVNSIHSGVFYLFVERQKKNGTFTSEDQSQVDFIRNKNIKYVLASKSARIPAELQQVVSKTIVDSKTGERFLIIAPQSN